MSFSPIRVVSDGSPNSLKVMTGEGEVIPCKSVQFFQNYGEAPVVTLELVGVPADLSSAAAPPAKEKRHHVRSPGFDVV